MKLENIRNQGDLNNPIKQIRDKHSITQQQLCDLLKVSKRTVENWETGKAKDWIVRLVECYCEVHCKK